jgi:hypothetical protein
MHAGVSLFVTFSEYICIIIYMQASFSFAINPNQKPILEKGERAMYVLVSGMMYYT